jgi:hypothetical protein
MCPLKNTSAAKHYCTSQFGVSIEANKNCSINSLSFNAVMYLADLVMNKYTVVVSTNGKGDEHWSQNLCSLPDLPKTKFVRLRFML